MSKLTASQAVEMTDAEVSAHWFRGASPSEPRALRDYVEDDAIIAMADQRWRSAGMLDSCWRAIDAMFADEGY